MNVKTCIVPNAISAAVSSERESTAQNGATREGLPAVNLPMARERMPALTNSSDWDEAFTRVQSYLHAYQIRSALQLNELTSQIIEQAKKLAIEKPSTLPVRLAMQVAQQRMADWFQATLSGGSWLDERFRARGRLAVLLSNVVTIWPEQFLSSETASEEIKTAMQFSELQPGPEVRLSKMPPASLEFGFGDSDEEIETGRWGVHPAVGVCVVIVGAMGAAWAATH